MKIGDIVSAVIAVCASSTSLLTPYLAILARCKGHAIAQAQGNFYPGVAIQITCYRNRSKPARANKEEPRIGDYKELVNER